MSTKRIAQVRTRIEKYREARTARCRLPAELWDDAVEIAAEVGVYAASKELGVSYGALRTRAEGAGNSVAATFVEVDGASLWASASSSPVIEIAEPSGARLTIRGGVDVASVVRAFRERR